MAISLKDISRNTTGAPRIVLYGVAGIGKTTLAACAPKPIFLQCEDGLGRIDADAFPRAAKYDDVLQQMAALIREPNDYQTVVLDSLDALEPLLWEHVCSEGGKKSIEDFGYGKGYVAAAGEWRRLLSGFDMLREQGKAIILIAHSQVTRFESPEVDAYDRYQLRLDKRACAVVGDWADAILFANYRVAAVQSGDRKRGVGDGTRVLHTTERPAFAAKNRFGLPDQITIPAGDPAAAWQQIEASLTTARN